MRAAAPLAAIDSLQHGWLPPRLQEAALFVLVTRSSLHCTYVTHTQAAMLGSCYEGQRMLQLCSVDAAVVLAVVLAGYCCAEVLTCQWWGRCSCSCRTHSSETKATQQQRMGHGRSRRCRAQQRVSQGEQGKAGMLQAQVPRSGHNTQAGNGITLHK
jgi:hypothetical protein